MNNLRDFFHQRRVPFSKAAPSLRFRLDGATIIRSFCCRRHFSLFFSFSLPCSIFFFPLPYSFFWPVEASAFYRDRETIFPPTGTTDRFRASFKRYHGEFDEYWMANGEWSTPCRFGIFFFFIFLRRQSSSFSPLFRRMRVKKSWKVKEYRFVKGENNCEWKN